MFLLDEDERVVQMIPGQGWRMLIAEEPGELEPGMPEIVEEPVIAWAIVEMKERVEIGGEGSRIQQLVPLIREVVGRGYMWEFSEWRDLGTILLAPGEVRTPWHDERAIKRQQEVAQSRAVKHATYDEARKLRRDGLSYEAIASRLCLAKCVARTLALQVDEQMRREKK